MKSIQALKKEVWEANLRLKESGLIILTWGNASEFDRQSGLIAIKPSGVSYEQMKVSDIVVLDLSGKIVEGQKNPSVDTPTHLEIYRNFSKVNGIVHTHSLWGTSYAQAGKPIHCYGTTHADHFYGDIPVTRKLKSSEMEEYELNTGKVIVATFQERKIDPSYCPGCLVNDHGVFTWGKSVDEAVNNGIVLEFLSELNQKTASLGKTVTQLPDYILSKHFLRKHGKDSYYGQKKD